MKASYGWLLKFILAAILIAVGFTMYFNQNIVFLVTGIAVIIFALIRVVPLMKSLKKEVQRTINLIEIILTSFIGILLVYVGIQSIQGNLEITSVWGMVYKYGLTFVFVARAIVYLYSTTFLDEKSEQIKFWTHLLVFAMGVSIAIYPDFNTAWVALLILGLSLLGSVYLIYDGGRGYGKYRQYSKELNDGKQNSVNKEKVKEKELPSKDKVIHEKDEDRPYVS